jgi:hypothetical protein
MSAADAKMMEEEYQLKVLQKDFITQPPLHCYVRLAIEHEPIQIASVFLARPESWGDSSKGQDNVRMIRDLNHKGGASAQKIDDDYKEHLQRFLDVHEFVGWVARRVEEQEKRTRYRDSTQEDKKQERHDQATLPSQSKVSEQKQVPDSEQNPSRSAENAKTEGHTGKQGDHLNGSTSPGDGQNADGSAAQKSNGRNNKRSRRLKRLQKQKVGSPPPGLQGDSLAEASDPLRPIPFPSGRSRGSGYEGRERGERV